MIDEQLAGHVEGLDILRGAIGGMEKGYSTFQNVPKHIVVAGRRRRRRLAHLRRERGRRADRGRGRRTTSSSDDGKIAYMANFHDTRAVRPVRQPEARTGASRTAMAVERLRLHRRRHRLGGVVRREPPERGLRRLRARARGGRRARIRRTSRTPRSGSRSSARRVDWGYIERAAAGARRPATYEPRGKMPGGVEQPLHHDAHPRPRLGLRQLGLQRLPGLELRRSAFRTSRSSRTRRTTRTRPAARAARSTSRTRSSTTRTRPRRRSSRRAPSSASRHRRLQRPATWRAPAGTTSTSRTASATQHEGGLPRPGPYRENLTVSTDSQATRLILENDRCVGVEYVKDGEQQSRRARRREVIVCARRDRVAAPAPALGHRRGRQHLRAYGDRASRSSCRAWARTSTTTSSPA